MKNSFVTNTRIALIRIGKIAPFLVCAIIALSYIESIYALATNDYVMFDNGTYLNKPISWYIGNYFKYDIATVFILSVLSISVETCLYNKMACAYLGVNLIEKSYFDFEMDLWPIYIICTVNIIISTFIIYKGVKNVLK